MAGSGTLATMRMMDRLMEGLRRDLGGEMGALVRAGLVPAPGHRGTTRQRAGQPAEPGLLPWVPRRTAPRMPGHAAVGSHRRP
jgi:hypothetical protein